jgi:aconitate hydratase
MLERSNDMPESMHDLFNTLKTFEVDGGKIGYYSLPALEARGVGKVSKLPVSIRIMVESLLRNYDNHQVTERDIVDLANWNPKSPKAVELPFKPARVVAQDFTGVPLLVDLAAMRSAVKELGDDPRIIEPTIPVELVIDHSVQVDAYGTAGALKINTRREFERNKERYEFLKWGQGAFKRFRVIPPSIGIVHQVNLEYLAKLVIADSADGKTIAYPDTLVGTDSHTTMINGLGIVGWGVGGIEAEAAMLGQPVYILTPEVLGVHLRGKLKEGVTATDLVLTVTERLRKANVVDKFVEFFGEGVEALSLPDRATISNMCPEYGATIGFFPPDEEAIRYLRATGREEAHLKLVSEYLKRQNLFGIPRAGDVEYSHVLEIDLSAIEPSVAGPKRPQDRIELSRVKDTFYRLLRVPVKDGGYGLSQDEADRVSKKAKSNGGITHGDVVIAAITSCTNTSNPSVMIGAGLLAKKAVERGLRVPDYVKTSLAPGSRVVTEYLLKTGLLSYLEKIGFNVVGYGCTTCIGNSGPLNEKIKRAIDEGNLVAVSVLSGNRNFEARVHLDVKANFLMSPPLVVAYALAGRIDVDLSREPLGYSDGKPVYLKDVWPTRSEIAELISESLDSGTFRRLYSEIASQSPEWDELKVSSDLLYNWNEESTYIQKPPFFEGLKPKPDVVRDIKGARILAILGDSVTTDHISPAGSIDPNSPAGKHLIARGVEEKDFNSYGSRRGNDKVMSRGTFANRRLKNLILSGVEGGYTIKHPEKTRTTIYEASQAYAKEGTPLVVFAGKEYGSGSSRDWAAKGPKLLGVKAVVAESYERIHRSNLIGMGILPLQFKEGQNAKSLGLTGGEVVSIIGVAEGLRPGKTVKMEHIDESGGKRTAELTVRIDTPIEVEYYKHGGILDYVIRSLMAK